MDTLQNGTALYERYVRLVKRLCDSPEEGDWFEFKIGNGNPDEIGAYVSSLSNSAALAGKRNGYLIWGVDDKTHTIVGSDFDPNVQKKGNLNLETWLLQMVNPHIDIRFFELFLEGNRVVVMEVPAASERPTRFNGKEAIRNGSHQKYLEDFPAKEARLWAMFREKKFEELPAKSGLSEGEVLSLLSTSAYYSSLGLKVPSNQREIVEEWIRQRMVEEDDDGTYVILNAGALLLSEDLGEFPALRNKAIRVIEYGNDARTMAKGERSFPRGGLVCFNEIMEHIKALLPKDEDYESGRRVERCSVPLRAIREALGNVLSHQDYSSYGPGAIVGVHPGFVEFSTPGSFDGDPLRAIAISPKPRNLYMTAVLHLAHICEERGSGFDIIEEWMGMEKLPSALIYADEDSNTVVLQSGSEYTKWGKNAVLNTIYQRCCFCYVNGKPFSNSEVRGRLGIDQRNAAIASRLLKECLEAGLIKTIGSSKSSRDKEYVPFWA